MQCPVDGTQLVMTERQGVEIDYCPKCRGVWLDRGELDKIIERAPSGYEGNNEPVRNEREASGRDERERYERERYEREPDYRQRSNYEDERRSRPEGLGGILGEVLGGSRGNQRHSDDYRHSGDYRRDEYNRPYKKKKKSGFLGELFDFD